MVLAGPSGVGKGTLVGELRAEAPDVWVSVSATTRRPRAGELPGHSYLFMEPEEFEATALAGGFLEHAQYSGARYGTPRGPVVTRLDAGQDVLLEIDLAGARQVRATMPEAMLVFLAPPSWQELERRLNGRGTEHVADRSRRLATAREEMAAVGEFDAVVVNDEVERAAAELLALMRSHPVTNPPRTQE